MPGKILGIDISEHNISAVQIISGLKGYQAVSCLSIPVTDNNPEKALEELSSRIDLKSDKCLISIPPLNTSFRNITTPFKDSKKIRQTLPFEMETIVPFAVDEMIIDYVPTDVANPESVLTAAINKGQIGNIIEQLKTAGVDPDIIDIRPVPAVTWLLNQESSPNNGIYLDLEIEHPCAVIFQNKRIVLIRELHCTYTESTENADPEKNERSFSEPIENIINTICREADRTVYSYNSKIKNSFIIEKIFFGGRLSLYYNTSEILYNLFKKPVERINVSKDSGLKTDSGFKSIYKPALMDHALAICFRESKKSIGFNFRRGEFALKRRLFGPGKDIRRIAILLTVFFVFLVINSSVDFYYLYKRHSLVEAQFNDKFDRILPEEKGKKDSRIRLLVVQQKLQELGNPSTKSSSVVKTEHTVLDILKEILQRVDEKYDFVVDRIQITNKEVSITANTDNVDTVGKIVKALELSDMFIKVEPGRFEPKNERMKFDLKLDMAN